jgi:DNA-binding beta-propeller fold protein YncE
MLRGPSKVAASPDGRSVAISDTGNDRVVVVDLEGGLLAEHEGLRRPRGVSFGPGGELLVCESRLERVVRVAPDGSRSVVLDGLRDPWDVAAAADGGCVVAAAAGHCIWRVKPDGTALVLAGSGREGLADGRGKKARLGQPSGVAIGVQGVFVADASGSAVRILDRFGQLATLVFRDLDTPRGVAPAPDGSSLYIADTGNDRLCFWSGVDGGLAPIDVVGLRGPAGLDVLGDGRLVVADTGNDRVVIVDLGTGALHSLVA